MKRIHVSLIIFFVVVLPAFVFGQGTISGRITDSSTGQGIAGANVVVDGTELGAAANSTGFYEINNVPSGTKTVIVTVIGYTPLSKTINVSSSVSVTANFSLSS